MNFQRLENYPDWWVEQCWYEHDCEEFGCFDKTGFEKLRPAQVPSIGGWRNFAKKIGCLEKVEERQTRFYLICVEPEPDEQQTSTLCNSRRLHFINSVTFLSVTENVLYHE